MVLRHCSLIISSAKDVLHDFTTTFPGEASEHSTGFTSQVAGMMADSQSPSGWLGHGNFAGKI